MSGPKGRNDSRLDLLERQVQQLLRMVGGQPSRYGHGAAPSQVRLARTASDSPGGGYQISGNTFPIVFLDGDFTESPGTQTVSTVDRQSEPATKYAHDVANTYREEGAVVWVVEHQNKYYIVGPSVGVNIVVFTLNSPLATSSNSVFATVVRAIVGPLPDEETIIVKNTEHIQEGEAGAIGYAIKNNEGAWDILLVECPPDTIPPQDPPASPEAQPNIDDTGYSNPYLDPSSPDFIPPIEMMQPTPVEFLAV